MSGLKAKMRRRRMASALSSMVLGTTMVVALLLAMNARQWSPPEKLATDTSSFEVKIPKAKPPAQKRKKAPKPKAKSNAPPPPAPMLTAGLSGLSFGLQNLDGGDLGAAAERLIGNTDNTVMTAESVDAPPKVIARKSATYPPKARARGITGFVTLSFMVDKSGNVQDVKVLDAQPPLLFEHSAMETIRTWRFEPGLYEGQPVAVRVKQTVRFDLS